MVKPLTQRQEVAHCLKSITKTANLPPKNILKAQVEEDYLKADRGWSFFLGTPSEY